MRKNKRNTRGLFLMLIGVLFLLGAAGLSAYNIWDEQRAANSAMNAVQQFESRVPLRSQTPLAEVTPDYVYHPEIEPLSIDIDGDLYVGIIEIPKLSMSLPIMHEWSYPNLKKSPCRYTGSPYQDDMVLAGHNYTHHFGGLSSLLPGDELRFIDAEGNVFNYTVLELEQLQPTQIEHMVLGDSWDLTLFTCTMSGRARTTVRCKRVED